MPIRRHLGFLLATALALGVTGCKSALEKESERIMPAVEALAASVPPGDPKDFVQTATGYADTIKSIEDKARELRPPEGSPAAAKLGPVMKWVQAAKAEHAALEAAFQREIGKVEFEAQADLATAVSGGETKPADQIPAALARTTAKLFVLWHGAGGTRGFDEDYQSLPAPARRAVDPSGRFIVGYVQRVGGEGVTFVDEKVTAEQKVVHVALYELPSKRRFGVFTLKGETARLPKPVPPPGTVIPGIKPPLVESLLRAP